VEIRVCLHWKRRIRKRDRNIWLKSGNDADFLFAKMGDANFRRYFEVALLIFSAHSLFSSMLMIILL
jgi:hypothetical protein